MGGIRLYFKLPHWRSLKTRVTLFTLIIFLTGLWRLAFYISRMQRDDMQRLLGYLFSRPLPLAEFEARVLWQARSAAQIS